MFCYQSTYKLIVEEFASVAIMGNISSEMRRILARHEALCVALRVVLRDIMTYSHTSYKEPHSQFVMQFKNPLKKVVDHGICLE